MAVNTNKLTLLRCGTVSEEFVAPSCVRFSVNTMTDLTIFHGHSRSNTLEYIDDEQASVLTAKVSNVVSEDVVLGVLV